MWRSRTTCPTPRLRNLRPRGSHSHRTKKWGAGHGPVSFPALLTEIDPHGVMIQDLHRTPLLVEDLRLRRADASRMGVPGFGGLHVLSVPARVTIPKDVVEHSEHTVRSDARAIVRR